MCIVGALHVGRKRSRPTSSDPELDTRASQPHRNKKRYAHLNTLLPTVHFSRHVTARVVGVLRWLFTLSGCSATENKSVHRTRRCALSPLASWCFCVCMCVLRGVMGWICVSRIHTHHPSVERLGSDDAYVVAILVKATFQSWFFCRPSRLWKGKRVDLLPGAVPHNLCGSEAFAPNASDPELDTRASQPHREKKRYAHRNTLSPTVHLYGT